MKFQPIIGLEVHAQLNTKSKIFSGAATEYGAEANVQACAIDLGMPGVLPVLNKAAVEKAILFGLSVEATINHHSVFDRKNYFYPDLPKGYQISQFHHPIVTEGTLMIILEDGSEKIIGIERAHLEEDAGKSLHDAYQGYTGIDLNRAGTPLLEIVSKPDLRSAKEAVAYLKALHALLTYLDICDGNLQEGSFRCDANVSVHIPGTPFGTRCEIKNINSFRFVEKAIEYEIERQIEVIENGGKIIQQTRLYNSQTNTTHAMRSKENSNDYRYFPDPDLAPVKIDDTLIQALRKTLPELPAQKRQRFMIEHQLSHYDASVLVSSKSLGDFFERVLDKTEAEAKTVANWVLSEFLAALNEAQKEVEETLISVEQFGLLLTRIADKTISGKIAKTIFQELWESGGHVDEIIKTKGLSQVSDAGALEKLVDDIIQANPTQVADYRSGKDKLFGYFVGQAMKLSQGKANPEQLNAILKEKLKG